MTHASILENKTFDEIEPGDTASLVRTLKENDITLFAAMSGDVNPAHLDEEYARSTPFQEVIAHGMWGGALLSTVLGTLLPGPGAIYSGQTLKFRRPVKVGDVITVKVTAVKKHPETRRVIFDCICTNQKNETVIDGQAEVVAPEKKIRHPWIEAPQAVLYERGDRLKTLIAQAQKYAPLKTAVAHPVEPVSLEGAIESAKAGLITPLLVGPAYKIRAAFEALGADPAPFEIIDAPHSHGAADIAVNLAATGRVDAIMKGALHTDEIMGAVVSKDGGLRTERRISHIYVMDAPAYPKILFITDAAINILPDLEDKRDILQNAIDLARALGVETPKAACLSAVETVYPPLQSTIEAAALCKMADRGQITGGVIDGPLAFDNAVSADAAATKSITSDVAGDADILLAPNLEAGNMLAKQLDYLAGATSAGLVLGARTPIILTSRAERTLPRMASCAVASLYVQNRPAFKT